MKNNNTIDQERGIRQFSPWEFPSSANSNEEQNHEQEHLWKKENYSKMYSVQNRLKLDLLAFIN